MQDLCYLFFVLIEAVVILVKALAGAHCITYCQWLKCKIRGGGTIHSGLGPWQWSCAFP